MMHFLPLIWALEILLPSRIHRNIQSMFNITLLPNRKFFLTFRVKYVCAKISAFHDLFIFYFTYI